MVFISDCDSIFLFIICTNKGSILEIKYIIRTKTIDLYTINIFYLTTAAGAT